MASTQRNLRIDDELWEGFGHAVASRDPEADRSKAIRRLMRWYAQDPERAEAAMRLSAQTRAAEPVSPEPAAAVPPAAARPGEPAPEPPRRTLAAVPPEHEERILILPQRVPEPMRLEYRRKVRDAHAATRPAVRAARPAVA
jgi:hypothetical protein